MRRMGGEAFMVDRIAVNARTRWAVWSDGLTGLITQVG